MLEQLEKDVNHAYEMNLVKPISNSFRDDEGGACALTAAYILHNGEYKLLEPFVDFNNIVVKWADDYYDLEPFDSADFISGFDYGFTYRGNIPAYKLGLRLREKWNPILVCGGLNE